MLVLDDNKFTEPLISEMSKLKIGESAKEKELELSEIQVYKQNEVSDEHLHPENRSEDNDNSNENVVGLRGFVDECCTFEEAFELLNLEG